MVAEEELARVCVRVLHQLCQMPDESERRCWAVRVPSSARGGCSEHNASGLRDLCGAGVHLMLIKAPAEWARACGVRVALCCVGFHFRSGETRNAVGTFECWCVYRAGHAVPVDSHCY